MRLSPHPVTLRQLQYVVAVADRQSFRKAAEACRVSQPSLSAQLAQVEEVLAVKLFERDPRGVRCTAAGERFVAQARALLVQADELVDMAGSLGDPLAGVLRLGVIPTIGPYLLPEVAPRLRERFPKLSFHWQEEKTATLLERIAAGALDGAILARTPELAEMPGVTLGEDAFVFAAAQGHPLAAGKRPLRPDELDGQDVLLLDDGHCLRDQALEVCSRRGAHELGYRATSLPTLVQMVAGGAGATLLPTLALEVENRRQALVVRSFAAPQPSRTLALCWRRTSAREPALQAVGEELQRAFRARRPR
jgi:LysR family hydrogen peroxide-inducible transcriptional activator